MVQNRLLNLDEETGGEGVALLWRKATKRMCIVAFRQVSLRTDDGEEVDAVWVGYKREERAIAAVWAAERLVAVDPSPETDDPDWIDSAFVITDEDGFVLRANPGASCLWQRNIARVRV